MHVTLYLLCYQKLKAAVEKSSLCVYILRQSHCGVSCWERCGEPVAEALEIPVQDEQQ